MHLSANPIQRSLRHLPVLLGLLGVASGTVAQEKFSEIVRSAVATNQSARALSPRSAEPADPTRWQLPQSYATHATSHASQILMGPGSAASARPELSAKLAATSPADSAFSVPFDESPSWMRTAPTLVHAARQFRRQGLPLLHLWQSQQYQLALGLSNHGRPGLYFTQKLAE
jgi:hypothetical protein